MKKNLLLSILFLLAVPLVFVPAESKGADTTPPTFGGLYNCAIFAGDSIYLDWPDEATDESPPITYNIYWSTVSGGQDFSTPNATTTDWWYIVDGLQPYVFYYFVVRAEDSFGNEETNTVERYDMTCQSDDYDCDGYTQAQGDCNDGDPNINPGAVEDCTDLIDNDCDNLIDAQDPDAVGCVDTTPPTFGGLEMAVSDDYGNALLYWDFSPATDESPPITYNIYMSASPGGQNFSTPYASTTELWYTDLGLECDVTYYYVVRAEDSFGNEETNTVEHSVTSQNIYDWDCDGWEDVFDCNDQDPNINPDAVEVCTDGIDNDCDDLIDAQDPDAVGCATTTTTIPATTTTTTIPGTTTTTTTIPATTTTTTIPVDADNDGYDETVDCNDGDPNINPGAEEDCTDLIDNDCDDLIDAQDPDAVGCPPLCTDGDGDTYNVETQDCGVVDCNDSDASINPGAVEDCTDYIDNDCDNNTDCDDSECIGDPACQVTVCSDYTSKATCNEDLNCEWSGSPKNGTCQDAVVCVPDETPEATCTDGVDNDCDGLTDCADTADCGADPTCQGGSCDTYTDKGTCTGDLNCEWVGSPKSGTCQDAAVCVPDQTPEATCTDGVDNDCDGLTDCADTADCGADPACQGGSCDTYTDKTSCQSNGCTWDNKDKVCI